MTAATIKSVEQMASDAHCDVVDIGQVLEMLDERLGNSADGVDQTCSTVRLLRNYVSRVETNLDNLCEVLAKGQPKVTP